MNRLCRNLLLSSIVFSITTLIAVESYAIYGGTCAGAVACPPDTDRESCTGILISCNGGQEGLCTGVTFTPCSVGATGGFGPCATAVCTAGGWSCTQAQAPAPVPLPAGFVANDCDPN